MKNAITLVLVLVAIGAIHTTSYAEDLTVLGEKVNGTPPGDMMKQYMLSLAEQLREQWNTDYENRKTPEQITEYQKRLKSKFIEALGGFPERTPLNAQVSGTVKRQGYIVEKIIFESQPAHYVTALLFLPDDDRFKKPYPGVLIPCGHSAQAKGYDLYQFTGLLDKEGLTELYEGDMIKKNGTKRGHSAEKALFTRATDITLPSITSKDWPSAYKKALGRGCKHAK